MTLCSRSRARSIATALALMFVVAVSAGCERKKSYRQNTPEATVDAMFQMIKDGNVHQLTDLIHTDDENLRGSLDEVGRIVYRGMKLTKTVRDEYPTLVEQAIKKAESDGADFAEEQGRDRGRRGWGDRVTAFLLNPSVEFEEFQDEIDVVEISDDMFAVTQDGQPMFGVGMILRKVDDKWYFEWPSTIPGLNTQMPQNEAEWKILNSVLRSVGNGVSWAEKKVEDGELKSLDQVWGEAAENIFPNVVVGFVIYQRAIEARKEAEAAEKDAADSDEG